MNIQYLLVLLFACAAGGMTYVLAGEPFRKPLARARMSIAARKGMHAKPTQRMKIAEAIDRAGEAFEKIIPLKLSESRELQDKLDLAGLKITPSTWRAISLGITIFTAIMLAGAALVGGYGIAMALLVGIIGAVGGWAVCGVWLSHAGKTRGEEIDRYLPPALELLTISVSAGVLVERGFRQLAENKALGPLADEFARTDMEISHLGVSRVDALDHMRRRCDSPLMGYFCAALIEATRKGTSISGVLESQAKLARKARYDALTAQINKLSTKMAVPLVFFLIAVLVLILPPLIIPTANKDMTNERSLAMSNENKNTNVKEETTWTNFKFFNNQVKLKTVEKDDRQMYLADCRFMPGSVANGIDLGDQNGISGHMTVFLTEKQYFKAAEQKANGEQINVGLPSTQLKDGKIEVNFYNHESKEAHTIQVNPFAASKANKAAREAFFERKDAEREQGKSLGAKAASARGASEKLDGQTQAAPAKDNLEH